MKKLQNYINGQLVPAQGGGWLDNYAPGTGQVYSLIPDSDAVDVEAAVEAAEAVMFGPNMGLQQARKLK